MENVINVYIKVEEGGEIPRYGSVHAAGCDLFATQAMVLRPGETKVMPLNFIIAIDKEMEAQIRPRSGLSLKTNLRIPNGPGTVDSDYRDIVGVIIQNTYCSSNLPYEILGNQNLLVKLESEYREISLKDYIVKVQGKVEYALNSLSVMEEKILIDKNNNPYGTVYINKGDRIAQMVFAKYKRAQFIPHPNPKEVGEDRGGGFGHTGKN
ncbi:MAG: dUTP diphosphatase [Ruminiclostridium sp.]